MKAGQLRGYILEEALAFLIRSSGYELIVDSNKETNLRVRGAGLEIKGRGGWHQADVLGRLEIIPAFTFPMRLFIEAKYHSSKPVGVGVIRNAIGTIFDLNTAGSMNNISDPFSYNYRYEYSLFSATGFNREATELALAHGISLIDLNTSDYEPLLTEIYKTTEKILSKFGHSDLLRQIRTILRTRLETSHSRLGLYNDFDYEYYSDVEIELNDLIQKIQSYNKLYLGTLNAPFMLLLKADDPFAFEDFSIKKEGSEHLIEIHWNISDDRKGKWVINPESNQNAYSLSFKIPKLLDKWIFAKELKQFERALTTKEKYLSNICVYLHNKGVDKIIKLKLSDSFIENYKQKIKQR